MIGRKYETGLEWAGRVVCNDASVDAPERIAAEGARILSVARAGDLAAPVPKVGRWKLRDVIAHLGGVHRWANRIVNERSMDGPRFTASKLDREELLAWFDEGLQMLVTTLATTEPAASCPNFNPGSENTVAWWTRRQLHETTVHRCDVEAAAGLPTPIVEDVAADGVDEFLDTFVRTRGKQTATAPVVLTSDEPPRSWTVTLSAKPGRVDVTAGDHGGAGRLVGAPDDLLLLLWNRRDLEETGLVVEGDADAVRAFLGGA
ncbi:MAG: maleylpyruvate isomerase family mycothiol-dependent enzyme [Actinomycetota bacterium]